MLLFFIFTVFIVQCNGYECPHYDNVHEIKDGSSERFEKETIFSCNNNYKVLLYTWECQILIFSCTFNSMIGSGNGGAIYLEFDNKDPVHPESIIKDCQFTSCSSKAGGAIYVNGYNGTILTITNTIFDSNSVDSFSGGGALYIESCYPTISKCRFINNDAKYGTCLRYLYPSSEQNSNYIYMTIQDCYFSHTKSGTYKNVGMIYFCQSNSFDIKLICTGNEIDLSNVADLSFLYSFSQNLLSWSKLTITNNYISPFERSRFLGNMNLNSYNFEGNNHQYQKPVEPDFKYENHKEEEKVVEKIKHTGSSEKTTLVKISDSSFKDFKSDGDGGLFYLKDIEVQCENTKIKSCEAKNGAGGGMYVKNTNDKNIKVNIINVQFSNCKADYGGALYLYSSSEYTSILVESCIFEENTAMQSSDTESGGSAVYCCITNGAFLNCQFIQNYGGSHIKVTDPSEESLKTLGSKSFNFFNCSFVANKESKEMIYYIPQNGKVLKIVRCNFNGKLAKGVNYVDGKLNDKNQPSIILDDCQFEYYKINKKIVISSSSSLESFMKKYASMILIIIGIVALAGIVLKLKMSQIEKQNNDNISL